MSIDLRRIIGSRHMAPQSEIASLPQVPITYKNYKIRRSGSHLQPYSRLFTAISPTNHQPKQTAKPALFGKESCQRQLTERLKKHFVYMQYSVESMFGYKFG